MVPDEVDVNPAAEPTTDLSNAKQYPSEPERRTFEVKLFQVAEVHTETWTLEAPNEADARAQADEILSTKELAGVEHHIEVEDVTPAPVEETEEPAGSTLVEDGPTTDTPNAPAPAEGQ